MLAPVTVSPPVDSSDPTVGTCSRIISAAPLRLDGLDLRRTTSTPPSASIVAWGDPAVVLRCGVARPRALVPGSSAQTVDAGGVTFLVEAAAGATTFTVIDRSIYLDVLVPAKYLPTGLPSIAAASSPIAPIATAVRTVLPTPVCTTDPNVTNLSQLCTRRK